MAPMVTRILPSIIWFWACICIALASTTSSIRPWLSRKCPRYSFGLLEAVEVIVPCLKKMRFSTPSRATTREPVLRPWESHCSSSVKSRVRRLPLMLILWSHGGAAES